MFECNYSKFLKIYNKNISVRVVFAEDYLISTLTDVLGFPMCFHTFSNCLFPKSKVV